MRVDVRIERLRALHAGEAQAEPYIWPLFFKIDTALFGDVLRARTEARTPTAADLATRRISVAHLPEEDTSVSDSFHLPGGEHGNLPPMVTGETIDVNMSWSATLQDGDGILRSHNSIVGIAAVLFEEDLMPGKAAIRKAYAEWAVTMQGRIRAVISKRIEAASSLPGPYSLSYRSSRDKNEPTEFDPISLEAELTKKMPHVHKGLLIDRDDFIGAMVWCRSAADLIAEPTIEFKKLWTPTTGSEEGSWELYVSASQA